MTNYPPRTKQPKLIKGEELGETPYGILHTGMNMITGDLIAIETVVKSSRLFQPILDSLQCSNDLTKKWPIQMSSHMLVWKNQSLSWLLLAGTVHLILRGSLKHKLRAVEHRKNVVVRNTSSIAILALKRCL
jgi:hypothetical protein